MRTNLRTKDYSKIQREYDEAYKKGEPFRNPEWFVNQIKEITDREKGRAILDIACGDGHVLSRFNGYDRHGVDLSKEAIKKAQSRKIGKFYTSQAEKLPFKKNVFDIVMCLGSLEHFIDMDAALCEIRRVAKDGALVVIHVPNSNYIIHKALGIETKHQTNERFADEAEWKFILNKHFSVEKTLKYNTRALLKWIPKKWSCHFTFLCRVSK